MAHAASARGSVVEVFLAALRLGLTSFGGPVAHIGYFRHEYVERRRWVDDATFADTVALCQALPGPASSQIGIAIGTRRAGYAGGIAAWLGFTLPSALLMALFALVLHGRSVADSGWVHGLKVMAVAVVAQAVLGMARALAPDRERASIAAAAAVALLAFPGAWTQVGALAAAGGAGWLWWGREASDSPPRTSAGRSRAVVWFAVFAALLLALPVLRAATGSPAIALFEACYRAGSLVFGGGHVVLPLLEGEFVPRWLTRDAFLAGYGVAQAVPGPLFTLASYLGGAADGPRGVALATTAIFLPSFLLVWGVLPVWDALRDRPVVRGALRGVNAAVVGVLAAALYDPVWTAAIHGAGDVALLFALGTALFAWKAPPWLLVLAAALGGEWLAR